MKNNYFDVRAWLVNALLLTLVALAPAHAAETLTFIHTDAVGSPVAATDQNGAVLWREAYRPYGERTRNEAASTGNRQFFHGKAADPDTGLSYFGARYYDPIVGRFMGVDPQHFDEDNLHSFNRYAYGNNNPYKFTDLDGRVPVLIPVLFGVGLWLGFEGLSPLPQVPAGSGQVIASSFPDLGISSAIGALAIKTVGRTAAKEAAEQSAQNVANGPLLKRQLAHSEAASIFENGGLRADVIARSTVAVPGSKLNNPALVKTLTADGSNIADWAKMTTQTFNSPSGRFQVHFYQNLKSGATHFGDDFKSVFNHNGAWR